MFSCLEVCFVFSWTICLARWQTDPANNWVFYWKTGTHPMLLRCIALHGELCLVLGLVGWSSHRLHRLSHLIFCRPTWPFFASSFFLLRPFIKHLDGLFHPGPQLCCCLFCWRSPIPRLWLLQELLLNSEVSARCQRSFPDARTSFGLFATCCWRNPP